MGRVEGKVALVTGAASGLGAAIAERLAQEGATVVVADVDRAGGEAQAQRMGNATVFLALDVTSEDDWRMAVDATVERHGRLDILVNNAGITLMGSVESISLADFRKTLEVDLIGPFLGCRTAIPALAKSGRGSIVNISSMAGLKAGPDLAAYNAAKAGVTLFTKSVALHCAREKNGVRCNSVHPGVIRTPILDKVLAQVPNPEATMAGFVAAHPIGYIGEPADIANIVLYLSSDESKFATGAEFVVDGGSSM